MKNYNPTFAISFTNTTSGQTLLDFGRSDLKTAKGAAKNWLANVGQVLSSFLGTSPFTEIKVIVRPVVYAEDCISMQTKLSNAQGYINREVRHGASVFNFEDVIS